MEKEEYNRIPIISSEPLSNSLKNHQRISDWFQVEGDLDDFIFYYEDGPHLSER